MKKLFLSSCLFLFSASSFAFDWDSKVDQSFAYRPEIQNFRWAVKPGVAPVLNETLDLGASNNNIAMARHEGRLFMAWRSAPIHFASADSHLIVASSGDDGATWKLEGDFNFGTDVREPFLVSWKGELFLYLLKLGNDATRFTVDAQYLTKWKDTKVWTPLEQVTEKGESFWDVREHDGRLYVSTYKAVQGGFNQANSNLIAEIHFKVSDDGVNWGATTSNGKTMVYRGGGSECSFEFDQNGDLYAVVRNEDGDETGFGSLVFKADQADLSNWKFSGKSISERYDSPRMFRHGNDLYLLARRDVGGPFDRGNTSLSMAAKRILYWGLYSMRPKRSMLYKIDKRKLRVLPYLELPGVGDTALYSFVRESEHEYTIANYTSPLEETRWSWLQGQSSPVGTSIYFIDLFFNAVAKLPVRTIQ